MLDQTMIEILKFGDFHCDDCMICAGCTCWQTNAAAFGALSPLDMYWSLLIHLCGYESIRGMCVGAPIHPQKMPESTIPRIENLTDQTWYSGDITTVGASWMCIPHSNCSFRHFSLLPITSYGSEMTKFQQNGKLGKLSHFYGCSSQKWFFKTYTVS